MRARLFFVFFAACQSALLVGGAGSWGKPTPKTGLEAGKKYLNDMEDAKALKAFEGALSETGITPKARAQLLLYIGIAQINLTNEAAAKESFGKALDADPAVELPKDVSPKIKGTFDQVKTERETRLAQEKQRKAEEAARRKAEADARARQVVAARPKSDPQAPLKISAWATLGLAVVAGATGLGLGVSAKSLGKDAAGLGHTYSEAESLHNKATGRALGANVLFGIAGAAAIASAVLFYFGYGRSGAPERRTAAAGIDLVPGGAVIGITATPW